MTQELQLGECQWISVMSTLFVVCSADSKGLILGNRDEPLSGLGNVQASKVAEFLLDMKVCVFVALVCCDSQMLALHACNADSAIGLLQSPFLINHCC